MPLSEHEQRILAEIERGLLAEDPGFVERTRKASSQEERARRLRWAVVGFVVGLVMLLGLTFNLLFGFAGFGLMLASVVLGVTALTPDGDDGDVILDRLRRFLGRHDRTG